MEVHENQAVVELGVQESCSAIAVQSSLRVASIPVGYQTSCHALLSWCPG